MKIWDFSRSDGAGSATTRNTRGLTRSVIALITPPLPAASRPSNTTTTRKPLCLTHSCKPQSSTCSSRSAFSYSLRFIGSLTALIDEARLGRTGKHCESAPSLRFLPGHSLGRYDGSFHAPCLPGSPDPDTGAGAVSAKARNFYSPPATVAGTEPDRPA